MHDTLLASLQSWTNFYVIVGSSAGALTGLQFVVMALVSDVHPGGSMSEIRAFGSPTVVHFCAVLFISATLAAPWQSIAYVGWNIVVCGAAGTVYILNALRHALRQSGYQPDAEDWFWYAALPTASYVALLVTGLMLRSHTEAMLFLIAGIALVLLYTGIHNAWDTVTYIIVTNRPSEPRKSK
jgi:hypothetical protein